MRISASDVARTIEKCHPSMDEGEKGEQGYWNVHPDSGLWGRPAVCAAIQVCPSYWICVLNYFSRRCVSSFFQVEPYFIFLARAHFIIPTFPILVSSGECIKTLFTPLLRSLRHRTGRHWGPDWASPFLHAALMTHTGPQKLRFSLCEISLRKGISWACLQHKTEVENGKDNNNNMHFFTAWE